LRLVWTCFKVKDFGWGMMVEGIMAEGKMARGDTGEEGKMAGGTFFFGGGGKWRGENGEGKMD
jgi:hypothetical protein